MKIGERGEQGQGKLSGEVCAIREAGARELLIVPQASLAGKMKSKKMQYHGACAKDLGLELYSTVSVKYRNRVCLSKNEKGLGFTLRF